MKTNDSFKHQPRIMQRNAEQWFSEINANEIQPKLFNVLEEEFSFASIEKTADDINNLLASVIGNISLAKMELKSGSSAVKYLAEAEKACIRTKACTKKLLNVPAKAENSNRVYFINHPQGEISSKLQHFQDQTRQNTQKDNQPGQEKPA